MAHTPPPHATHHDIHHAMSFIMPCLSSCHALMHTSVRLGLLVLPCTAACHVSRASCTHAGKLQEPTWSLTLWQAMTSTAHATLGARSMLVGSGDFVACGMYVVKRPFRGACILHRFLSSVFARMHPPTQSVLQGRARVPLNILHVWRMCRCEPFWQICGRQISFWYAHACLSQCVYAAEGI